MKEQTQEQYDSNIKKDPRLVNECCGSRERSVDERIKEFETSKLLEARVFNILYDMLPRTLTQEQSWAMNRILNQLQK